MKKVRNTRVSKKSGKLNLIGVLLVLLVLILGCNKDEQKDIDTGKDETCNNSSHEGYQTLEEGSETREYILHISESYDSNTPTPLVINFHGFGDCAAHHAENVGDLHGLNALADNDNFLIAYPQGVIRAKESPEWDPGDNGEENIRENDVYFTTQLIADISSQYNVDLSRVYAVGYSNGGMMAYGLACSGKQVAAIGIMSGIMLQDDNCDDNEYTAVIHFHGIADGVLPYEGNQDFQPVADVVDFWLSHNHISASGLVSTELNDGDVLREEYKGGEENTAVLLYTIHQEHDKEGGHVWFSEEIDGLSPNQILWGFLSNYSLDD